jgi:hypothetical protein
MAIDCFALPWPTTSHLFLQSAQRCDDTALVGAPAEISAWAAFASVLRRTSKTFLHLGQDIETTMPEAPLDAFLSFNIWRTLGEAAMPSSPTALYWACTGPASANKAMPARAAIRVLFVVFIIAFPSFCLLLFVKLHLPRFALAAELLLFLHSRYFGGRFG